MKKINFTINNFLEEINRLQQAEELLDKIWQEIGPYETGKISNETMIKLQKYMGFDDSE